jgi:4-methoxybenzoate monooxygenase (O-demethylating)
MSPHATRLSVERVSAGYGGTCVLDDVSFEVSRGERVGILGRNGAGKTTTLACVMGLAERINGSITLGGEEIGYLPTYRRVRAGLGYVPQTRDIFSSLSVEENLLSALGNRDKAGRIEFAFRLFPRLRERRHNGGAQLSGGEQQMLAVARALVGEPRILLLDEPLEGLAPRIREELMDAIGTLVAETGVGCVLVEQHVDLVLDFTTRVLVLERGRPVYYGSTAELRAQSDLLDRAIGLSKQPALPSKSRSSAMTIAVLSRNAPESDLDPWSEAFMEHPFPAYDALRAAGPVVKLTRHGIWSVAHYAHAKAVLDDHATFLSSGGAGLANFHKEKPWRPPSIILEADQPLHTKTRTVLARVLSPGTVRALRAIFERDADAMIEPLVARGEFDAIKDLADPYPFKVFPDAVGLAQEGRENLVLYGKMVFAGFGPKTAAYDEAMSYAPKVLPYINEKCSREALAPGGLGAEIYKCADTGELTEQEAGMLVRSLLSAGIDTTVNGIGQALHCLARHPDQWQLLADDPSLARAAFDETLRFDTSAPFVFRTTARDVDFHGTHIPEHEKLLVFVNAANRDPARWKDPDRFDIRRKAAGHLGFGSGIHGCVGQMVARLEAESALSALARRVRSIEIVGAPARRPSSGLRGLSSLPVRVEAK